jgi:hypothetical protein
MAASKSSANRQVIERQSDAMIVIIAGQEGTPLLRARVGERIPA